jgi:hypothetical protein
VTGEPAPPAAKPPRFDLTRLSRSQLVAAAAALLLLLVMALDWYSTPTGQEARRVEDVADPEGLEPEAAEAQRELREDARVVAEGEESNAWQPLEAVDVLILVLLLATVALALLAAFLSATDRKATNAWIPTALTATAAALLIAYRMLQEPGLDAGTEISIGAPLGLLLCAGVALASAVAMRSEEKQ